MDTPNLIAHFGPPVPAARIFCHLVVVALVFLYTHSVIRKALTKTALVNITNSIVASIHAVVATILGIFALWMDSLPIGSPMGPWQRRALTFSVGYFGYDTFMELNKTGGKVDSFLIHHLVSGFGLAYSLFSAISGTETVAAIVITEFTTPLMHWRQYLKKQPEKESLLKRVTVCFGVLFMLSRCVVFGPYLAVRTTMCETTPRFLVAFAWSLFLISAYWGVLMLRVVVRSNGAKGYHRE